MSNTQLDSLPSPDAISASWNLQTELENLESVADEQDNLTGSIYLPDNEDADEDISMLSNVGNAKKLQGLLESLGKPGDMHVTRLVNTGDDDGFTALMYASRHDHLAVVLLLLHYGANVHSKTEESSITALHLAAWTSFNSTEIRPKDIIPELFTKNSEVLFCQHEEDVFSEVIWHLVDRGADVNVKTSDLLYTPLHYSAVRGNHSATKQLLTYPSILIESRDVAQMTPLHTACVHGHIEVAKALIDQNASVRAKCEKGQTPLHKAASAGCLEIVKLIIDNGMRQNILYELLGAKDFEENTPLVLAIEKGSMECVEYFLKNGANVNISNRSKTFPIHSACANGNLELVKLLIKYHAKINSPTALLHTPLITASIGNHEEVVRYLLEKGAYIEARDKRNSTALIRAAGEGSDRALKVLIEYKADILAVDSSDRSSLYFAVFNNHIDIVNILLENDAARSLINMKDRFENTPMHVACYNDYIEVASALMEAKADTDIKNIDEDTPMLAAAGCGYKDLCLKIMDYNKYAINHIDLESRTPLHVACHNGHAQLAKTFIDCGADIMSNDYSLWTPLHSSAYEGHKECAKILIDAGCPVDVKDMLALTPLLLACEAGHSELVAFLLEEKASVTVTNQEGMNALSIALTNGHRNVAIEILKSPEWQKAMSNIFVDQNGHRQTPLRMMIRDFPDIAKTAFDLCLTSNVRLGAANGQKKITAGNRDISSVTTTDDKNYAIQFNYEFLDDMYKIPTAEDKILSFGNKSLGNYFRPESKITPSSASPIRELLSPWDDNGRILPNAIPYNKSYDEIKKNHCLSIMVKNERVELLGHPLCMALVRRKWTAFGRYVYYLTLFLYMIFLLAMTAYVYLTPPPFSSKRIIESTYADFSKNSSDATDLQSQMNLVGFDSDELCKVIRESVGPIKHRQLTLIIKYVILGLAFFHILKEVFQWAQAHLLYFSVENLIEWFCYISAILFVFDFNDCTFETGIRQGWQWRIGAISITFCWLNLLSNVRKVPLLGIYVVMFTDIMKTFLKFSLVCILFVIAFSFGFFALLPDHENFASIPITFAKTFVMMVGEFDFGTLFFPIPPEDEYNEVVPFPTITLIFFVSFIVIMPIIIMNLLVGLAVDDIKSVQDNAMLSRLAMKVELNLHVEKNLPDCLRRRFIIRKETVLPNQSSGFWSELFSDGSSLHRIKKAVINEHVKSNEVDLTQLSSLLNTVLNEIKALKEQVNEISTNIDGMKKTEEEGIS